MSSRRQVRLRPISGPSPIQTRRTWLAAATPVVVAAGLAARFGLTGAVADTAGGVLYTAMVYLVVAFARPRWQPARIGAAAFACSALVELFQLTPVPAELGEAFAPFKLLLGSTFVATDFVAYAAGAIAAAAVDARLDRRRVR